MSTRTATRKNSRAFIAARKKFFSQCRAHNAPCWLCGMPIDYTAEQNTTDDSYNLDHLYPVSKRPDLQFDPAGFRPSHTSCNRTRGNNDPPEPLGALSRQWINPEATTPNENTQNNTQPTPNQPKKPQNHTKQPIKIHI